jgi:uncharacterized membrane protein YciS (DUF1049 family)
MPDDDLDFLGRLAKRSRDISSVIAVVIAIAAFGWVLSGNIYFKESVANVAGVETLRADLNAKLEQSSKDFQESITKLVTSIDSMNQQVSEVVQRSAVGSKERQELIDEVAKLKLAISTDMDDSPAIRFFSSGNKAEPLRPGEPIRIGEFVRLTWSFIKLRDCGKSQPDDLIMDINGVQAHLAHASIIGADGKGIATPVDPNIRNEITYTAQIPDDVGLSPGPASIWVQIVYDPMKCPRLGSIDSPRIPLTLTEALPDDEKKPAR